VGWGTGCLPNGEALVLIPTTSPNTKNGNEKNPIAKQVTYRAVKALTQTLQPNREDKSKPENLGNSERQKIHTT
jgi:hypothetical protein